jgi:hypothetical protein
MAPSQYTIQLFEDRILELYRHVFIIQKYEGPDPMTFGDGRVTYCAETEV